MPQPVEEATEPLLTPSVGLRIATALSEVAAAVSGRRCLVTRVVELRAATVVNRLRHRAGPLRLTTSAPSPATPSERVEPSPSQEAKQSLLRGALPPDLPSPRVRQAAV